MLAEQEITSIVYVQLLLLCQCWITAGRIMCGRDEQGWVEQS